MVTDDELLELIQRCTATASAAGGTFVFDELPAVMSERQHARYLRSLAQEVGMNTLAARLDPAQFSPGTFEAVMELGRIHGCASLHIGQAAGPSRGPVTTHEAPTGEAT